MYLLVWKSLGIIYKIFATVQNRQGQIRMDIGCSLNRILNVAWCARHSPFSWWMMGKVWGVGQKGARVPKEEGEYSRGQGSSYVTALWKSFIILTTNAVTPMHSSWTISSKPSENIYKDTQTQRTPRRGSG